MTTDTTPIDQPQDEYYLKEAPMFRALTHLAVPMMFAMAAGTIYNVINAYFLGTLHSTPILAALTYALPITVLAFAIGGVFGSGGSAYVARLLGAGDRTSIKAASAFTLYGAFFTGVIISALCLVLLGPVVGVLGTAPSATAPTTQYVFMLLLWGPIFVTTIAAEQLVRAMGAARQSMYGLLISTLVNLGLDALLILGLHMGVTGAALAVGAANLAGLGYYLLYLHRRQPSISLNIKDFRINRTLSKEVLGVGAAELIQSAFLLATTIVLNHVATAHGPALLAAFGVANRIVQLPEALTMGIGIGVLPLFAYAFGAANHHRLHQAFINALVWIAVMVVVFGGIVFILRDQVLGLFSNDASLIQYGTLMLTAMLVSTLFNGFTGLLMAYFQGTAKARAAAILGFAMGGYFIPTLIFGNLWFGANGVIWSLPITEILCFVTGIVLFLTVKRSQSAGIATTIEPTVTTEMQQARVAGELGIS